MTAVVTGAAGGIGSAVVRAMLSAGRTVVGVDLEPGADGPATVWVRGDVSDPAVIAEAFTAAADLGGAEALITCTFGEHRGALLDLTTEDLTGTVDRQVVAAWAWSRALVTATSDPAGAAIVHVSSVHAAIAAAGLAPYALAKAALEALSRAMAVEWGPLGVRCNAVAPGFVPVPRNAHRDVAAIAANLPLRRVVTADDVAACVRFLASDEAAGVTGICLTVDAGMSAAMPPWA